MSCDAESPEEEQEVIPAKLNQVPLQRGDSTNKERGGRHLPANHKLRGPELAAAAAARDPAAESGQQQARDTLRQGKGVLPSWPVEDRCRWSAEGPESTAHDV